MKLHGRATGAPRRTPSGASGSDRRIERLEPGQHLRRQRFAGDVGDVLRQIANVAILVDKAGLLRALLSEPHQLHETSLEFALCLRSGGRSAK